MTSVPSEYDVLLTGATVLTAQPEQPLMRDGMLGVTRDRITLLEPGRRPFPRAKRRIDLPGRIITPGFVNVHTHSILAMVRGVAADVGFAPSYTPGIPKGSDLTPEQARALARLGALEALSFGSTLIADNFVHADVAVEAMAELGLRVHASWRIHDVDFARVARGEWIFERSIGEATLNANLELARKWHDKGRVTVQLAAHAADTCSEDFLKEVADLSRREGLRVNTHLAQSEVEVRRVRERTGRTPVELFDRVGLLNDRLVAGHCIHVSESDIAMLAQAGVHVAHIPKCNAASGRMAPTAKMKQAGVNLTLASDTQHADMVEVMRWALAVGRLQEGAVTERWQPADVFHMATLAGARAMGLEDELGSLRVGKKADLVVFDFRRPHLTPQVNPLGTLVHVGQGRDVEHVMIDGEMVLEEGRPARVDMLEVCAEAERAARRLWAHAGSPY